MRLDAAADFVYVRLHSDVRIYTSGYTDRALAAWARRIRRWSREGRDVYVYFDNDVKVRAPFDALSLMRVLGLVWQPPDAGGPEIPRYGPDTRIPKPGTPRTRPASRASRSPSMEVIPSAWWSAAIRGTLSPGTWLSDHAGRQRSAEPVELLASPCQVELTDRPGQRRADAGNLGQSVVGHEWREIHPQRLERPRAPLVRAGFERILALELQQEADLAQGAGDGQAVHTSRVCSVLLPEHSHGGGEPGSATSIADLGMRLPQACACECAGPARRRDSWPCRRGRGKRWAQYARVFVDLTLT
jgi:hypothetical protein